MDRSSKIYRLKTVFVKDHACANPIEKHVVLNLYAIIVLQLI